jgi:hypothetical protein
VLGVLLLMWQLHSCLCGARVVYIISQVLAAAHTELHKDEMYRLLQGEIK